MKIVGRTIRPERLFLGLGIFSIFVVVFSVPVYLLLAESYIYLTRSDKKAEAEASEMFLRICQRNSLDPRSFRGPDWPNPQVDKENGQYNFVWTRGPDETIDVAITYFPHDYPYSISRAIIERQWASHHATPKSDAPTPAIENSSSSSR